jgi:hypothetical protein
LMPIFEAFAVTSARNLPWQLWQPSQNNQIHQNVAILSKEPLVLTTLFAGLIDQNSSQNERLSITTASLSCRK